MSKKSLIALLASAILLSVMLCACGDKQKNSSEDSSGSTESAVTETTAVLETTADGGTVEQDSEGNKITKDKDGIVIAVEDKDGNQIEVTVYLKTHTWVEKNESDSSDSGSPGLSDASDESNSSDKAGSSAKSSDSSNSSADPENNSISISSASQDDQAEDEIPVIIATLPDDDDLAKVPDL